MISQYKLSNELSDLVGSPMNSPIKDIPLKSKFTYRHHKYNATKLVKSKSAYMFFSLEVRADLKQQGVHLGPNAIMKKISDLWKEVSRKDKAKYEALAAEDKERYRIEKEELMKTNPSEVAKNRTKNNHIKKPWSAYDFFMSETYPKVKAENPELYSADILKIMSKQWKSLNSVQKGYFQKKADKDKKEKRAQLKAFELKKFMENNQMSTSESGDDLPKASRKKVKLNNNQSEMAESTTSPSGTYEDFSEMVCSMSSEFGDTFEAPSASPFLYPIDTFLSDQQLCPTDLSRQSSRQECKPKDSTYDLSLIVRKSSADQSTIPAFRLEDFKLDNMLHSFDKYKLPTDTKVVNMLEVDMAKDSFDELFNFDLPNDHFSYLNCAERQQIDTADFFSHY